MTSSIEEYISEGCGRCPLGGTADCKVHLWTEELKLLRRIVLECNLNEEIKWGAPCYTSGGKNVLMISALKSYCCISFFKGALIQDPKSFLVKPGEHSQAARMFKFTGLDEIERIQDYIKTCIIEAVEIEEKGLKVEFKQNPEPLPEELIEKFDGDPVFKNAFEALTPGRQRGYILHFSKAKQASTRMARIEKCAPMILSGIGLHDKYKSRK